MTAKIVTLVNQKGGVGKTTTAINLGASLAACERNILLVDLDPQANATSGLGLPKNDEKSIYPVLTDGMSIREIARQFGHSRPKIREVLKHPEPRPYQRSKSPRPKLTLAFQHQIEAILQQDETAPRKQRHTAVAIHRRLVDEG